MNTHQLARQLTLLAKSLRQLPDMEIESLGDLGHSLGFSVKNNDIRKLDQSEIPAALNALVALNDVSKQQWLELISTYSFDIDIRQRDAKRDIVGKLLNYLAENEEARLSLSGHSTKRKTGVSNELASALNLLLK